MKTETLVFLGIIAYLYYHNQTAVNSALPTVGTPGTDTIVSSPTVSGQYCIDQGGNPYFVGTGPCPVMNLPTVGQPNPIPTGLQAV